MFCEHNAKLRKEGLCDKCSKTTSAYSFRYCKKQCFNCNECGWFASTESDGAMQWRPHQFGPKVEKVLFTTETVRTSLAPKWDGYYAKLAIGQSPTWICDERTKELFCLSQWIMEELMLRKCPDEDRIRQQRFFNRKARATEDLYELAATTLNGFLTGKIDDYRGRG